MGNYIQISSTINGKSVIFKYNHLNGLNVKVGDQVSGGFIIGLTGTTGNVSAAVTPHVHIQAQQTSNWECLNPKDYLSTKFDKNQNAVNNCK